MGCRMGKFIKEGHDIKVNRVIYWSDNQTVLSWLRSDSKQYKQFVAHRVGEIQEDTNPQDWRWVPTKNNVADEVTRDTGECNWKQTSRWCNGPDFLRRQEVDWPVEKQKPNLENDDVEDKVEMKREYVGLNQDTRLPIDINKYSTWNKLIRVTAFMFFIIKYCFSKDRKTMENQPNALVPSQIHKAEAWWWQQCQKQCFPEEIKFLQRKEALPNSSRLLKLSVYLDDDQVIRINSRIRNAECVPVETKFPVVLDPKHRFTKLLISHYHCKGGHHGMERVVNELKQKYYILNVRSAVRSAWNHCQSCKNYRSRPVVPEMSPLPSSRLTSHVRAFTSTGVDYFGPKEVTVGRHHEKRYGVLFTCLSTRAIHLEIASSLTTDSCIMAIRRFIGRRGSPVEILSDNGTNFKGAKNELKAALLELNQHKLINECTNHGIVWKFIPPAAPHMGGSWERMVRSVKVALDATLKERYPTDEVLQTLMVEAEHIVNSHPLTHVPIDPDDAEALTPNHFLLGQSSNVQSPGMFQERDMCLRKQWRKAQALADHFWRRWVREYLPTLLRRNKWFRKCDPIQLGDVVVEVNEHLDRNCWPMGIVVKLYPSKDQLVRSVDVKFSSTVLKRPVAKLCILDVRRPEVHPDPEVTTEKAVADGVFEV